MLIFKKNFLKLFLLFIRFLTSKSRLQNPLALEYFHFTFLDWISQLPYSLSCFKFDSRCSQVFFIHYNSHWFPPPFHWQDCFGQSAFIFFEVTLSSPYISCYFYITALFFSISQFSSVVSSKKSIVTVNGFLLLFKL